MNGLRRGGRWLLAIVLGSLLLMPATALAQKKRGQPKEEKPVEQHYMVPWGITLTMISIGIAVICLPSTRKSDVEFKEE